MNKKKKKDPRATRVLAWTIRALHERVLVQLQQPKFCSGAERLTEAGLQYFYCRTLDQCSLVQVAVRPLTPKES